MNFENDIKIEESGFYFTYEELKLIKNSDQTKSVIRFLLYL